LIGGRDEESIEIDLCDTITRKVKEKGQWVTPFFMHPTDPETIYSGFGNLWKSTNGGTSWEKKSNFPNMEETNYPLPIFSMGYCFNRPENIVVYKRLYNEYDEIGQLWKTMDEGANWVNISEGLPLDILYIHDIAVNNHNPDEIIVVLSGFVEGEKVYFTTNGGKTWNNISKNLPNLPINAVVHQPNSSIYYIGTDVGVYYINDFISDWIEFDNNLPNTIVSDLVVNTKSNKIFVSTFGRGIWENNLVKPSALELKNDLQNQINVSPNPIKDKLNIEFTNEINSFSLKIIDISGKVVFKNYYQNIGKNLTLDINLLSGVYFIKIDELLQDMQFNQSITKKIIIE